MNTRLAPKCACMIAGYDTEEEAQRRLERIKARNLRSVMPKQVVRCWHGQWHIVGTQTVDTGPDRHTRDLVLERDWGACASCGDSIDLPLGYSLQHRLARGSGGTSNPAINTPANLITLCGSATSPGGCHLLCERRDPLMRARGFWLEHGTGDDYDPAVVPLQHKAYGWVLLNADGSVTEIPRGAA